MFPIKPYIEVRYKQNYSDSQTLDFWGTILNDKSQVCLYVNIMIIREKEYDPSDGLPLVIIASATNCFFTS